MAGGGDGSQEPRQAASVPALKFWRRSGFGISSPMAEEAARKIKSLRRPVGDTDNETLGASWPSSPASKRAAQVLRDRVAFHLERGAVQGRVCEATTAQNVYLFPTGMAAIYTLTKMLRQWPVDQTVVFGLPYELILKVQEEYAKGTVFCGLGDAAELKLFEEDLAKREHEGRGRVQAVWCETSSNSLLKCVDIAALRKLANRDGFLLVVDDMIGSAANVDVLSGGVADIVVTSLTKLFRGFADVMGGSIAVDPRSASYGPMKQLVGEAGYADYLCGADAIFREYNSRSFLDRAAKTNATTVHLVELLQPFAQVPASPLTRRRARGGLFTLDFASVTATSAFFDALDICKGPSLGALVSLAQPYVQTVSRNDKERGVGYSVNATIFRISVGVEGMVPLGAKFLVALKMATRAARFSEVYLRSGENKEFGDASSQPHLDMAAAYVERDLKLFVKRYYSWPPPPPPGTPPPTPDDEH
ncbi:pyridoxal phosphate-dependent transferase [Microdochium bolleyi]|uniref:Pyridoxal phosphate-dependent transferase n=1 Tax=Microdochium bolleyi TaxID=196109 RepID=A0A136ITN1_9PEZI|nr:pyridoxal phosphate-dependent transferase [Microdochium bolleyi]